MVKYQACVISKHDLATKKIPIITACNRAFSTRFGGYAEITTLHVHVTMSMYGSVYCCPVCITLTHQDLSKQPSRDH